MLHYVVLLRYSVVNSYSKNQINPLKKLVKTESDRIADGQPDQRGHSYYVWSSHARKFRSTIEEFSFAHSAIHSRWINRFWEYKGVKLMNPESYNSLNELPFFLIPKPYIKHSHAQSKPDYKDGFEGTSELLTQAALCVHCQLIARVTHAAVSPTNIDTLAISTQARNHLTDLCWMTTLQKYHIMRPSLCKICTITH